MANVLASISDELAGTVEAAGKSIVRVEGRRRLPASGIAWSADGVVVTANHVVEQDENLKVGIPDGDAVSATLAGRDPTTDLAVLRADASGLEVPALAEPADVRVGNLVLAAGRPGRTVQATLGIVSALGMSWRTGGGGEVDRYLQTDVVMYPGFSGGPLIDAAGAVVGLNSSALMRGFNVALPTPTLSRVVETLLEHGRVRRGYLGVGAQPARLPESVAAEVGQETGLLVVSVESASPADKGGLHMGDTIVTIDGSPTRHMDDLLGFLSSDTVGQKSTLRIVRGGQSQEIAVTIGERS